MFICLVADLWWCASILIWFVRFDFADWLVLLLVWRYLMFGVFMLTMLDSVLVLSSGLVAFRLRLCCLCFVIVVWFGLVVLGLLVWYVVVVV